jgi:hypothetical protein
MSIEELEVISETRLKLGHVARVRVCANPQGVAVDVREFITPEAHRPEDSRIVGAGRRAGSARSKSKSTYIGPTRSGLWITPEQAFELADALALAAVKAQAWEMEQAHTDALLEDACRFDREAVA